MASQLRDGSTIIWTFVVVFVQDSVPLGLLRAKATSQFLRQNTPDFIAADEWTSYSPDLNPLDFCIWDIMQHLVVVYESRLPIANVQDLKEAIKNKWKVAIETVRKSIAHCTIEKTT